MNCVQTDHRPTPAIGGPSGESRAPRAPLGWIPLALAIWLVAFGAYEAFERLALAGADPDLLHLLHILRGTGVSFLMAVAVAWYTFRQAFGRQTAPATIGSELEGHALWILRLRWVAVAGVLLTTFVCRDVLAILGDASVRGLLLVAGTMAVCNAIFSSLPLSCLESARFALAQVVLDLVALTVMLHFAGGAENPFSVFYLFHIVIAGILLRPWQAYAVTLVAGGLFAAMALLEATAILPAVGLLGDAGKASPLGGVHLAGTLAAFLVAAISIAYFTTTIVEKLRRRGAELLDANENLALERARTEDIVQSVGAGLIVMDRHHQILWANDILRGWFGDIRPGEMCFEELWGHGRACPRCPMARCDGGVPSGTYERATQVGGRRRFFLVGAAPVRMRNGSGEASLALVQDITSMKEMEIQLVQASRLAAVGEFAAGVAHEINNPLAIVASSAEIASGLLASDHPLARHLKKIEDGVFRCKEIIQNLLDFSRQGPDEAESVDLKVLVGETIRLLEGTGRARSRALVAPCAAEGPVVLERTRPRRIQQVLLNLLLNAVDATGPGGTVRIAIGRTEDGARIEVSDDGVGIAPEALPRIYEPFFTTKPAGKGTGLGLYVSHQIVQSLDGRIAVESEPGRGATFRVELPHGAQA